jgi:hypothetical protein
MEPEGSLPHSQETAIAAIKYSRLFQWGFTTFRESRKCAYRNA